MNESQAKKTKVWCAETHFIEGNKVEFKEQVAEINEMGDITATHKHVRRGHVRPRLRRGLFVQGDRAPAEERKPKLSTSTKTAGV